MYEEASLSLILPHKCVIIVFFVLKKMKRKDRIALVVSAVYFFFPLVVMLDNGSEEGAGIFFTLPIVLYWGYRFIKGDISFIKNTEDEKS